MRAQGLMLNLMFGFVYYRNRLIGEEQKIIKLFGPSNLLVAVFLRQLETEACSEVQEFECHQYLT